MTVEGQAYWNSFYGKRTSPVPMVPSQFAVFTIGEIPPDCAIIDIGCGSGRDSLFFASIGRRVIGIDGSSLAIEQCRKSARDRDLRSASFICCDVDDTKLGESIGEQISGTFVAYARFFIHAIDDDAEAALLSTLAGLRDLELLVVEFRTDRDAGLAKVTPSHFRRFVPPLDFLTRATGVGFSPIYFAEGFGFAKFREDDAHVARMILRRD